MAVVEAARAEGEVVEAAAAKVAAVVGAVVAGAVDLADKAVRAATQSEATVAQSKKVKVARS